MKNTNTQTKSTLSYKDMTMEMLLGSGVLIVEDGVFYLETHKLSPPTLSRDTKRWIRKNNFKKGKRLIIPMTTTEDGRRGVLFGCLSIINHPKKIYLPKKTEEDKKLYDEIKSYKGDGRVFDFIVKEDGGRNTLIKEKNKIYEWESGIEIITDY